MQAEEDKEEVEVQVHRNGILDEFVVLPWHMREFLAFLRRCELLRIVAPTTAAVLSSTASSSFLQRMQAHCVEQRTMLRVMPTNIPLAGGAPQEGEFGDQQPPQQLLSSYLMAHYNNCQQPPVLFLLPSNDGEAEEEETKLVAQLQQQLLPGGAHQSEGSTVAIGQPLFVVSCGVRPRSLLHRVLLGQQAGWLDFGSTHSGPPPRTGTKTTVSSLCSGADESTGSRVWSSLDRRYSADTFTPLPLVASEIQSSDICCWTLQPSSASVRQQQILTCSNSPPVPDQAQGDSRDEGDLLAPLATLVKNASRAAAAAAVGMLRAKASSAHDLPHQNERVLLLYLEGLMRTENGHWPAHGTHDSIFAHLASMATAPLGTAAGTGSTEDTSPPEGPGAGLGLGVGVSICVPLFDELVEAICRWGWEVGRKSSVSSSSSSSFSPAHNNGGGSGNCPMAGPESNDAVLQGLLLAPLDSLPPMPHLKETGLEELRPAFLQCFPFLLGVAEACKTLLNVRWRALTAGNPSQEGDKTETQLRQSDEGNAEGGEEAMNFQRLTVGFQGIFETLGPAGLARLCRWRLTPGSYEAIGRGVVPPTMDVLWNAFHKPHTEGQVLSVGSRALSKHIARDETGNWWGKPSEYSGRMVKKNQLATQILQRLLQGAIWQNTHMLPHDVVCFEIRVQAGYGARWMLFPAGDERSASNLQQLAKQQQEPSIAASKCTGSRVDGAMLQAQEHQQAELEEERTEELTGAGGVEVEFHRWADVRVEFRGFLEPPDPEGHEKGWHH